MKSKLLAIIATAVLSAPLGNAVAGEIVFEGFPIKRIELTEQTTASYDVSKSKSAEY